MLKKYTCIICPNGCEIEAKIENQRIISLKGATCNRGREYVQQELTDSRRNIASSVLVENGVLPLVSVRLTAPIPKMRIFDVMAEIKKIRLQAPVSAADIVISNVLGLGCDVIATKSIDRVYQGHKDKQL